MTPSQLTDFRLQFITHGAGVADTVAGARLALEGGCRWIQLRMKDGTDDELTLAGRQVARMCADCGATFIVDDRVDLVERLGADGVHLGLNDMPVAQARKTLGPGRIIGATANTADHILAAAAAGADYIGLGPFRFTATKKNLSPVLGTEGYLNIIKAVRGAGIALPVVAIGGITAADIPELAAAGADGIAVSGAILRAADPAKETSLILNILQQ